MGGGFGIEAVGLALAAAGGLVGLVDLDDLDAGRAPCCTVGAGALHADPPQNPTDGGIADNQFLVRRPEQKGPALKQQSTGSVGPSAVASRQQEYGATSPIATRRGDGLWCVMSVVGDSSPPPTATVGEI